MKTWQELMEHQPLAARMLTNSIRKERISHAYVIQGERGTGKQSLAVLLAMTLFCTSRNGVEPCQKCPVCHRIKTRNHPDVHWLEPDGKSIKNEQIKTLRKEFAYTGYESQKKIYIISKAETLTINAANRILKFLEEPETETTAILLTENADGLLTTIQSRCQMIDLKPLDMTAFQYKLITWSDHSITESNARFLSALTTNIDEAMAYHEAGAIYSIRDLVQELIYVLLSRYEERYLFLHQKWLPLLKEKVDQEQGLELLLLAFRDIINYQIGRNAQASLFQQDDALLIRGAENMTRERLLRMVQGVLEAKQKMNQNIHPTLLMEQLVLQF